MSGRLTISLLDGSPETVVVDGELDLTTVDDLKSFCENPLAAGDVTLDLAALRFIDSTGLSALVELHHVAEANGTSLKLASVPDHARRLMQITKIDGLLGI